MPPKRIGLRDFSSRRILLRRLLRLNLTSIQKRATQRDIVIATGVPGSAQMPQGWEELEAIPIDAGIVDRINRQALALVEHWFEGVAESLRADLRHAGIDITEQCAWELHYSLAGVMLVCERLQILLSDPSHGSALVRGDSNWNNVINQLPLPATIDVVYENLLRFAIADRLGELVVRKPSLSRALGTSPTPGHPRIEKGVILFFVTGGSTEAVARAVIDAFEGQRPCAVIGPSESQKAFARSAADFISFEDAVDLRSVALPIEFRKAERRFVAEIKNLEFAYKGIDIVLPIRQWLRVFMSQRLVESAQFAGGVRPLLELMEPAALVACSFEGHWLTGTMIRLVQHLERPTITVQTAEFTASALPQVKSDVMAVQSESTRLRLVAEGNAADRIIVTGQPRYDHLGRGRNDGRVEALRRRLALDPSKKLLVFATDPGTGWGSMREKEQAEINIVSDFKELAGWELVFKLHPSDEGSFTRSLLPDELSERRVVAGADADVFILLCDAWACMHSTTALEALLIGKPVVIADYGKTNSFASLHDAGVAERLCELGDLVRALREVDMSAAASARRQKFAMELLGSHDGRSSLRVAQLVEHSIDARDRGVGKISEPKND